MKKILFVLSMLIGVAYGQSVGYFRYDTVVLQKIGGNSELKIMNATRALTGGVLTNMGNGRTAFVTPGGGTVTAANNGTQLSATTVQLGGALNQHTSITFPSNFSLSLGNTKFQPSPPNRFPFGSQTTLNEGNITLNSQNYSELGIVTKMADFGAVSNDIYNLYELGVNPPGSTQPYTAASASLTIAAVNSTQAINLIPLAGFAGHSFADSAVGLYYNGRGLNFASNGNVGYVAFRNSYGGTPYAYFQPLTNFLGLNTTSPAHRFDVNGTGRISNVIFNTEAEFGQPQIETATYLTVRNLLNSAGNGANTNLTIFQSSNQTANEIRFTGGNGGSMTPAVGVIDGFNYDGPQRQPLILTTSGFDNHIGGFAGNIDIRPGTGYGRGGSRDLTQYGNDTINLLLNTSGTGTVYLNHLFTTPGFARTNDTTGYDIDVIERSTGNHKKMYSGLVGGAGGGGGTPGGSNTQLQYNNSGAFGGISGATSNGTIVSLTTPDIVGSNPSISFGAATRLQDFGSTFRLSGPGGLVDLFSSGSSGLFKVYSPSALSSINVQGTATDLVELYSLGTNNLAIQNGSGLLTGIGTATPTAKLDVLSTTEQLRLRYDASNYTSTTVSSAGAVSHDATGSGASFDFKDRVHLITGSGSANVGGSLHSQFVDVGNVGTGEDNLMSFSVPANTLSQDGDYLEFEMDVQFTGGNTKTLKAYFGAQLIWSGTTGTSVAFITLKGTITRTGATTQRSNVQMVTSSATYQFNVDYTTPTETLSGAVTLKATGTATADNDIVQHLMTVKYFPAN